MAGPRAVGAWRRRPDGARLDRAGPAHGGFAAHQPPRGRVARIPARWSELIPGLARPMEGALIRRQARVNPLRAVARLAAGLPAVGHRGGRDRRSSSQRPGAQRRDLGRRDHPGAVVFATGRPPVLDGLPLHIPSDRVKGHLLVTQPTAVRLPGIVAPIATQIEDGQLLAGGTFDLGDESPAVRPDVIESIMDGLAAALPAWRARRIAPVVLLPAAASGPAAGDRPGAGPGKRLADLRAISAPAYSTLRSPPPCLPVDSAGEPPPEAGTWSATRFSR